jgi:hypothetical protein
MALNSRIWKSAKGALAVAALTLSCNASAETVSAGGIEWDTFLQNGNEAMSAGIEFQQWFTSTPTSGEYLGLDSVNNTVQPTLAANVGAELVGVGLFNGFSLGRNLFDPDFCAAGTSSDCELTFAFGGLIATSFTSFDFSNAWLNVYFDDTPDFFRGVSGINASSRYVEAQNGQLWASFKWEDVFFLAGGNLNGGVISASLSVEDSALPGVVDALDYGQGQPDFDLLSQALFFPGNVRSTGGSGAIQSVSAPSTVAFFGLTLIGLGLASRKKFR